MHPHTDDTGPHGYPPGVTHGTHVDVLLRSPRTGKLLLFRDEPAQNFGWAIRPHASSVPSAAVPVLAYRLTPQEP